MIQGTMSGAGKSLLTAGILRALVRRGAKAAPFKFQNMALNSYVTADGTTVTDGCILNNAAGTYIHGLFDEDSFREGFLRMLCEEKGLAYDAGGNGHTDRHAYREAQYDALADAVEQYMDLNRILEIMNTSTGIDANRSTDIETTAAKNMTANIEANTAKHVAANMDTIIVANRERNSAANSAKNSEMNSEK